MTSPKKCLRLTSVTVDHESLEVTNKVVYAADVDKFTTGFLSHRLRRLFLANIMSSSQQDFPLEDASLSL